MLSFCRGIVYYKDGEMIEFLVKNIKNDCCQKEIKLQMKKEELYNLLLENNIFFKVDEDKTKIFENDVIVKDEYSGKNFKVETNNMSNEDIIIALLAKQTLYIKTIKNVIMFTFTVSIISAMIFIMYMF